jgi:1,4-alpha-glucan branching enzyme
LARAGRVELVTTAATHAFLPAFQNDPALRAFQIDNGLAAFERRTGLVPEGFWLPECGYFPGLEEDLAASGLRWFVLEERGLAAADPPAGVRAPLRCPNGLLALGRDGGLSRKVWSARGGYPGRPEYREFHRDGIHDLDTEACGGFALPEGGRLPLGLKYWRVTGTEEKDWYDPAAASARASLDAEDFARALERVAPGRGRGPELVLLPFDAELFGHWWHEGPEWLAGVLRRAEAQAGTAVLGVSAGLRHFPDPPEGLPGASSWGRRADYSFWINRQTDWLYPHLGAASRALLELSGRFGAVAETSGPGRVLRQAARELLLAGASDWPFMIRAGTTMDYARERLREHLERFSSLRRMLESGKVDDAELEGIERLDPPFPAVLLPGR